MIQTSFDFDQPILATGEDLKNAGIAKAVDHANTIDPGWSKKAYAVLQEFITVWDGEFMTEDLREYAMKQKGFEAPMSSRAWGGPMVKAKNNGLIVPVGLRPVSNAKAHCANATVWKAVQ